MLDEETHITGIISAIDIIENMTVKHDERFLTRLFLSLT